MWLILIVVLLVLMVGGFPSWGYSANWGYGPSGLVGALLVVLLVLLLLGKL